MKYSTEFKIEVALFGHYHGINEACKKYSEVNKSTLSNWVRCIRYPKKWQHKNKWVKEVPFKL